MLCFATLVIAVAIAGCGSTASKSSPSHSTGSSSPGSAGKATPAVGPSASGASTQTPFHATFAGANHDPKIVVNWPYMVTATDAHGHPLAGTVLVEFTFGGAVVGRDASGTHHFRDGRWHDTLNFPASSVGTPLTLQAVIRTRLGTVMLHWPVIPKK